VNEDKDGQGDYFYCPVVELSTWTRHLDLPPGVTPESATDAQLYCALYDRQIREAYKMCQGCASPRETFSDAFYVCGTCARHCHHSCSSACSQVLCTEIWEQYAPYLRTCDVCAKRREPLNVFVPGGMTSDQLSAQAAMNRLKSVQLPHAVRDRLGALEERLVSGRVSDADAMNDVTAMMTDHYCPRGGHRLFKLAMSKSKGGIGVFAARFVPRLTRVGIYPGYPDPLSGEQGSRGRPTPKYALAEFNAADYYNASFPELKGCLTQFINEPGPDEGSNVAWLQEVSPTIEDGRLSIYTVRDLQEGEECTLSYGPLYPRDYPYSYDAYSFHPVSDDDGHQCKGVYALWYYANREAEAVCKGHVRYEEKTDTFRDCDSLGTWL